MRIIIIINIITCGRTKMASKKVNNICRFCNSAVAPNHCTQLFSTKSLSMNLPVRLSTLLQLPVNVDDGPNHCCRPCTQSFFTAEKFIATAKLTFESRHVVADCNTSPVSSVKSTSHSGRKRLKDTSGTGVSPSTLLSQPSSKRSTGGFPGRRLAFTACKKIN